MRYLKSFNESKNVGILYHYTNLENLHSIIRDNVLLGKKAGTVGMGISFTRDKKLHEREPELESTQCRITIDGNKLSNNYKIRPYNDYWDKGARPYNISHVESEERVFTDKIINIKKYIISVDFAIESDYSEVHPLEDENISFIFKLLDDNNIKYNFYKIYEKSFNESKNIEVPDYLYKLLPVEFYKKIKTANIIGIKKYDPKYVANKIYIPISYIKNGYEGKLLYIHELSHKFCAKTGIITEEHIDQEFKEIFNLFKEEFSEWEKKFFKIKNDDDYFSILEYLKDTYPKIYSMQTKFIYLFDLIKAITNNKWGYGHDNEYYKNENLKYEEVFVILMQNYFLKNELFSIFFPKSIKEANNYIKKIVYK